MTHNTKLRPGPFLAFAGNFVKHPKMLGWFLPSSRFLVRRVLSRVAWTRAKVVVEYGPGVGTFTGEILKRLAPGATLIAVETNEEFVRFLRNGFSDPRLRIVHESAAKIGEVLQQLGFSHADYIISGIPFKTIPAEARNAIIGKTHSVLHPKGVFLVYCFSRIIQPCLEQVFGSVDSDFEFFNIMPARMYFCMR